MSAARTSRVGRDSSTWSSVAAPGAPNNAGRTRRASSREGPRAPARSRAPRRRSSGTPGRCRRPPRTRGRGRPSDASKPRLVALSLTSSSAPSRPRWRALADQRMRRANRRRARPAKVRRDALAVGEHAAFLVQAQHLERDRRADRDAPSRSRRGRSALRRARRRRCVGVDLLRQHRRAHRHVARGQALGERHQVGFHAFGLAGEHRPGAAEAGDDLVDDEQDVELAGRVLHRLQPAPRAAR